MESKDEKLNVEIQVRIPSRHIKKEMAFPITITIKELIETVIDQLISDPRLRSTAYEYTLHSGTLLLEYNKTLNDYNFEPNVSLQLKRKTQSEMEKNVVVLTPIGREIMKIDFSKQVLYLLQHFRADFDPNEESELEFQRVDTNEPLISVLSFNDQNIPDGCELKLIVKEKKEIEEIAVFKDSPKSSFDSLRRRKIGRVVSETFSKLVRKKKEAFNRSQNRVPRVVEETIAALEKVHGYRREGLFRVNAPLASVYQFKKNFDEDKPVDFSQSTPDEIGGVLKLWLRSLNEPLCTFELYPAFIAAINLEDKLSRTRCLRQCIEALPVGNRTTLIALFAFLKKVADNEAFSKMSASNLAVCFAPTLLRPEVENLESMTSPHPKAVVTLLIEEYDFIFKLQKSSKKVLLDSNEFQELFRDSRSRLVKRMHSETEKLDSQSPTISSFENNENEISSKELAHCLLGGFSIEEYFETLPKERREIKRKEVKEEFDKIMKQRGISPSLANVILSSLSSE